MEELETRTGGGVLCTFDSEEREHTHGIQPSYITDDLITWRCHGIDHRENGKDWHDSGMNGWSDWSLYGECLEGRLLLW